MYEYIVMFISFLIKCKNPGAVLGLGLAGTGWTANLIVYLIQQFNLNAIDAAQVSNIVNGGSSLFPIVGAIIADSFLGCFSVISIFSSISLLVTAPSKLPLFFLFFFTISNQ